MVSSLYRALNRDNGGRRCNGGKANEGRLDSVQSVASDVNEKKNVLQAGSYCVLLEADSRKDVLGVYVQVRWVG